MRICFKLILVKAYRGVSNPLNNDVSCRRLFSHILKIPKSVLHSNIANNEDRQADFKEDLHNDAFLNASDAGDAEYIDKRTKRIQKSMLANIFSGTSDFSLISF